MNKIRLMTGLLLATLIPNVQGAEEENYVEMWFFKEEEKPFSTPNPTKSLKVLISTKAGIFILLKTLGIDAGEDFTKITNDLSDKYEDMCIKIKKESGDTYMRFRYIIDAVIAASVKEKEEKNIEFLVDWLHTNQSGPFGYQVEIYTEEQAKERAASGEYKKGEVCIIGSSDNLIPQKDFIKGVDKGGDTGKDKALPWTNSEKFGLGMGITLMATILTWGLYQKFMQKKGKKDLKEVE